jgi:hypothetical protein
VSDPIDYGEAPRPAWRTPRGEVIDGDELRSDDIEIDLTGDLATVRRKQWPNTHPWADKWPTWAGL